MKKIELPKIKPCPFCGGEGELTKTAVFWVRCENCGSESGFSSRIRIKAINAWNTRLK